MDLMKLEPSDSPKSPDNAQPKMESQPSDPISTRTPKKSPNPPQRTKYHRHSQLPEKYEISLRFFDALNASLRLLRLRKSIPVFTKIRAMIEKMSDRRFTHHHLAQLKYLLPKEMHIKRVLMPDDETRCMKYDLHVSCNGSMMNNAKKRKRGSKYSRLRDRFLSRLWQFIGTQPEGAEIPKEELPEPFNQEEKEMLLDTIKNSSLYSHVEKYADVNEDLKPTRASHFSFSFKKLFSNRDSGIKLGDTCHSPSYSSLGSLPNSLPKLSGNDDESKPVAVLCQATVHSEQKPSKDDKTYSAEIDQMRAETPTKSATTPILIAATPALLTPKRSSMSPDDNFSCSPNRTVDRPSCARSLHFDEPIRNLDIEVQVDETECSKIIDILPANLLQSVREKEKIKMEHSNRKLLITRLPKLFDRIHYLFQSPKSSALRKEALIRDLTECHPDITDESEVEEQLKLLQEIIPEWISNKLSPSGNIIYSVNKRLNPNTLRLRLEKAM